MNASTTGYPIYRSLFLAISFLSSSACLAEHYGDGNAHQNVGNHLSGGYDQSGGYNQNGGGYNPDDRYHQDYGYYQDDDELNYYTAPSIGNYVPGSGWQAPAVIFEPGNDNDNCQNIQQCDPAGNCVLSQNCD